MTEDMQDFDASVLKQLYNPPPSSHKGQNGKLLVIGGSHLFHAASLWALKVASRIVDMVFYSSVPENNEIVQKAKEEFRDGIVVRREYVESYIEESDCILIGPGMVRNENEKVKMKNEKSQFKIKNLEELVGIEDEGEQTYYLTQFLLSQYPHKKWVIDAGSLQVIDPSIVPKNAILTPHRKEFEVLFELSENKVQKTEDREQNTDNRDTDKTEDSVQSEIRHQSSVVSRLAKKYNCIILLKGQVDIVSNGTQTVLVEGGNPGMTKGGTGDVLAGLVAALACKNDPFLAAQVGSYVNKKAGDSLYERVGPYFNTSDLVDEIPKVLHTL